MGGPWRVNLWIKCTHEGQDKQTHSTPTAGTAMLPLLPSVLLYDDDNH